MPVLIVAAALLGLAVGSFLNVVIHRVPLGQSLIAPASHCPGCDNPIRMHHNIPVLGWLMLGGKCADCGERISARYPIVEAITGLLFVVTTIDLAHLGLLAALPAYLFFLAAGIALAAIDLSVMRLPNAIVYPTYLAVTVLLGVASVVEGTVEPFIRAVIGGAALFAGFFILAFAKPGGMGFGDVKLAGIIGGVLGFLSYPALLIGTFAAFVIGSVLGLAVIAIRQSGRGTLVPFGPAMIAGALVALFATAPLVDLYHSVTLTA